MIIFWRTNIFADCLNDMVQLSRTDSPIEAQISQFYNLSFFQELNHFQLNIHRFLEVFIEVFFFQMLAAEEGVKKYSCLLITIKIESGCRLSWGWNLILICWKDTLDTCPNCISVFCLVDFMRFSEGPL